MEIKKYFNMGRILSKTEVNEMKIAIAVLYNRDISLDLKMEKIWDIFDILKFEMGIPDDAEEFSAEGIVGLSFMMEMPEFVRYMDHAVIARDFNAAKKEILVRLIELEAYLEVIELGLDKIEL